MKSYVAAACLVIAACAFAGEASAGKLAHSEYQSEVIAQPQPKREALVLLVAQLVDANSAHLEMGTPKDRADAMKVMAAEQMQMGWLARDAGWADMQHLDEDTAQTFARIIRGELKGETAKSAVDDLERRRRQILMAGVGRVDAAGISPKDPKLQSLAKKIATEIAAKARVYTWGDSRR